MPNTRPTPADTAQPPLRFLRIGEVMRLTGSTRASIYLGIKTGEFPAQVKTGKRVCAWIESEIVDWMQSRIAASRAFAA